ncbi:MAG: hypothetical protein EOM66_02675 [Clostridia bacterium]|nr:hypothetical protein [Clostridia bacterium]
MWEMKFYARGGMGAVTAAKILTNAAILEGKFAQAIPSYGQERKGAPVYAFARLDAGEIAVKSYVYTPNCVLVFDESLPNLGIDIYEGLQAGGVVVMNTRDVPEVPGAVGRLALVDADKVTEEILGGGPSNMAMLGALVKATGCVRPESLLEAIQRKIPGKAGERNAEACARAYEETRIAQEA